VIERQQADLRLQPHMISDLRSAFSIAVDQLEEALVRLRQSGHIAGPWLGDEVSDKVATHYNLRAMEDPNSSYQALTAYRDELNRTRDTLQRMEDEYLGTDHQASADLRRRT
jgi:hypothetical protein